MAKASTWIPIATLVFVWLLISSASATTDASDVSALQDLYRTLFYPSQLTGWKSKGGDPCEEKWKGISCDGSSIIYIDLSSNHIQGKIPSLLPPNAINIDLSCNDFNMSIPYTLNSMIHLRHHLNFSHNALSGPIGNVFTSPHNLKEMDLLLNNFIGDLQSCAKMAKPFTWVSIIITLAWLMTYSASATTDTSGGVSPSDPTSTQHDPGEVNVNLQNKDKQVPLQQVLSTDLCFGAEVKVISAALMKESSSSLTSTADSGTILKPPAQFFI